MLKSISKRIAVLCADRVCHFDGELELMMVKNQLHLAMKATREMVTATHDMLDVTYDGIGAVKDFYWHLDEWSEIEGFRVGVEHAPTD